MANCAVSNRQYLARQMNSSVALPSRGRLLAAAYKEEEELHATDAAFKAEAAAHAQKYDVHKIAVRRLVKDLVENDESDIDKHATRRVTGKELYDGVADDSSHGLLCVKPMMKSLKKISSPLSPSFDVANASFKAAHSKLSSSLPKNENLMDKSASKKDQRMPEIQRKVTDVLQSKPTTRFTGSSNQDSAPVPDLGPYLLKLAKQAITSGESPQKALDFATRAVESYELAANGEPSLDLVMSLHVLAAIQCYVGQFEEAIPVLEYSITVPDVDWGGQDHALAAFAGYMQLGDTLAIIGKCEEALSAYHVGLKLQMSTLGEKDPHVGETCRYIAEAHTQALQFDKAEELCLHALDIHKEHNKPASIEEATDRRLIGLIYNGKGQHEFALENLVLARMALLTNGKDVDAAAVDANIADTYIAMGRFDEAVFSYQKALTVLQVAKGGNHVQVASVYVSLANAYLKVGKSHESRIYCESALRIYNKQGTHCVDEVVSGLTELALVYEALNEYEEAQSLLHKALSILEVTPGQHSAVAGVEAQIGVLNYVCGSFEEARVSFGNAVCKLRSSAQKNSSLLGIVLNQLGLTCAQLLDVEEAARCFEESAGLLQTAYGPFHPDTISVCSNLAGAYDASGRLEDAINVLQYIVEVREEKLGTAIPEADEERRRLTELLKDAGRLRARRANTALRVTNAKIPRDDAMLHRTVM